MNRQPGASRPDWLSKLVLPIAAAVLGAILVTALTPLGDNLREVLFPTKADVTGSVSVDGRRAAGARLALDGEPAGSADDEGTFVIRDVGDGDHTLEIKAVSSKLKRQPFTLEQGASSHALGEIALTPLARLGYEPVIGSSFEGITYDVTLWVITEDDVLDRITSVQYTLPSPFPASGCLGDRTAGARLLPPSENDIAERWWRPAALRCRRSRRGTNLPDLRAGRRLAGTT